MTVASVPILDPFAAAADPAMPWLRQALDPVTAQFELRRCLRERWHGGDRVFVRAIRVTRHKPGRRCLIEYDLQDRAAEGASEVLTLIGKVRARGLDHNGYQTQTALWAAGFQSNSVDGISVPEPVGAVPAFEMWLQRKVPGVPLTVLLATTAGCLLADRVAGAAHKLHHAGVPARRVHMVGDELRILAERLEQVAAGHPHWAGRLGRVLASCERLAGRIPPATPQGIHRDFYPDQIVVDGRRLYMLDFDLYSSGDPALDIGNFLGHVTELRLRAGDTTGALFRWDRRLTNRFLSLVPEVDWNTLESYRTLTLARHIWISTRIPERRPHSESLLELCEQRLAR